MRFEPGMVVSSDEDRLILLRLEVGSLWWVLNLRGSKIETRYDLDFGDVVDNVDITDELEMLREMLEEVDFWNCQSYRTFVDGWK